MLRSTLDVELKFDAHQKTIRLSHIKTSHFGALERRLPRHFLLALRIPISPLSLSFNIKHEEFLIVKYHL